MDIILSAIFPTSHGEDGTQEGSLDADGLIKKSILSLLDGIETLVGESALISSPELLAQRKEHVAATAADNRTDAENMTDTDTHTIFFWRLWHCGTGVSKARESDIAYSL